MSAGVCSICLGAAPAFTGALGERPVDRVIGVHIVDVHSNGRHLVICHSCTQVIVGAWARTGRRALGRAAVKAAAADHVAVCLTCHQTYTVCDGHVCCGPISGEDEDEDAPDSN